MPSAAAYWIFEINHVFVWSSVQSCCGNMHPATKLNKNLTCPSGAKYTRNHCYMAVAAILHFKNFDFFVTKIGWFYHRRAV